MIKRMNMKGSSLLKKNRPELVLNKRRIKQISKIAAKKGSPKDE